MKRLACALIALAAAELFAAAPMARAQDYPRYYDTDRAPRAQGRRVYDDDNYYQRGARQRGDSTARGAAPQDKRRGGFAGFLDRLFGGGSSERATDGNPVEIRRPTRQVRRKPPTPATPATPAAAATAIATPGMPPLPGSLQAPTAVPTAPTTFVAVFGDTVADELADGLAEGFADAPELVVKKHVKPNSGLVRSDYFDFVQQAEKVLGSEQVTYAVVDLGVNDRQPFLDQPRTPPLSDDWKKRYAQRLDAMLAPFKERKIPVYWVGLAASESRKATADHTTLNSIIKERVEAAGGVYVDVWDGFVDEEGDYMAEGPLLDGQTGKLRLDDGVHFSKDGARKLAHYAEREIRKVFTPKAPSADAVIGAVPQAGDAHPLPSTQIPGAAPAPRPISSPVVVLTEPRKAGDGALAGAAPVPAREASPDAEKVLVNGESLAAAPGRMDDHRWDGAKGLLDLATPPGQKPAQPPQAAAPKP